MPGKIAFAWNSRGFSGAQKRLLAICRALNNRGQAACILLTERDARALRKLTQETLPEIKSYRVPWWVSMWLRGRGKFPKMWSKLGAERMYFLSGSWFWKRLLRRENIALCHIAMSPDLPRFSSGPTLFEVTSPEWADRIINKSANVPGRVQLHAVSESVFERLVKGGLGERTIAAPSLFPNLNPMEADEPEFESKENLIVFAHRLIPRKNGVLFARAAKRFLRTNPEWSVSIFGTGPDEGKMRCILSAEIASGGVNFGYTVDLPSELKRSKLFVSIIQPDNVPSQSVVEAMIHGNALLLSNVGRTKNKFFSENGRLVNVDEDEVFAALCELTSSSDHLESMGLNSFTHVREKFSQSKYIDHLLGVYCQLFSQASNLR